MTDQRGSANQIFISYRRADSADITGRIYDHLTNWFGREAVFKDVDSIPLGVNFRQHLDSIISKCAVVLVVIGDRWLGVAKEGGSNLLDDPRDFVRIEVESALKRDIRIIPLLVCDASMPREEELPLTLREVADRQGITIGRDPHFKGDIARLISQLEDIVGTPPRSGGDSQATPRGRKAVTDSRPTLSSPEAKVSAAAVAPTRRKVRWHEYVVSMLAGAATYLLLLRSSDLLRSVVNVDLDYFYVSQEFMPVVALCQGFLGAWYGYRLPQVGWRWGLWLSAIALPLWLVSLALSSHLRDWSLFDPLPLAFTISAPVITCLGAYIGQKMRRRQTVDDFPERG